MSENSFSVRSTASSGYDSSESGSDCGSLGFHPISQNTNVYLDPGSSSPGVNTLRRQKRETRDLMLKQLENVIEEDQVYIEFEEVFSKKLNCNLTSASLVLNAEKNQNKEILPYEENRVILNASIDKDMNDYINASHVKMEVGKSNHVCFIAAQSPLKNTACDLWRMIWEQDISLCVLIRKEMDDNDARTFRYWPEDAPESRQNFGMFCIETKFVNSSNLCLTRGFKLTNTVTAETRNVYQMQYMNWPATGVPEDPLGFVDFLEEVRSMQKSLKELNPSEHASKLMVQCCNGAGRTGVFMLCETIIRLIENNQKFDVAMTLARLRTQRMYLIETVAQYRFAYLVIIQYLKRNRLI